MRPVIGQARATLVEQDQSERAREALVERAPMRGLPAIDEVRHEVGHIHEIDLALTDDLVRDRDATAAHVPDPILHDTIFTDRTLLDQQALGARPVRGTFQHRGPPDCSVSRELEGQRSSLPARRRCPLPSAFMTWASRRPSRLLTNAIFRPSGDHDGRLSHAAFRVRFRFPLPSAFMT
jgi:hypothetical protein